MNRVIEIALTAIWTAGLLLIWVVMIAVVLLPVTWLAGWWLGDRVELLDHPRRNAIVLGFGIMIAFIVRALSPSEINRPRPPERLWWRSRKRP